MFEYNLSQAYLMAKLHQEMLVREFEIKARNRQQAESLLQERHALRRFHALYRVRRWMHRLVPALARGMFH